MATQTKPKSIVSEVAGLFDVKSQLDSTSSSLNQTVTEIKQSATAYAAATLTLQTVVAISAAIVAYAAIKNMRRS